jgi:hypothetical protein
MSVTFRPLLTDIGNSFDLFEDCQASPACPSDMSSINTNITMEHLWKYSDGIKSKCLEKNVSSATLLTTNITWIVQGSKPGLSCEWPETNSMRHGTRSMKADVHLNFTTYVMFHNIT